MFFSPVFIPIARKTFLSYLINVKKLSAPEVKEITGTSADIIYKHYVGADVAEIAKKMRLKTN